MNTVRKYDFLQHKKMVREIFPRTIFNQIEQTNYLGAVKLFFGAVAVEVIFLGVNFFAVTVGVFEGAPVVELVTAVGAVVVDVLVELPVAGVVPVGETLTGVVGDLLFAGWYCSGFVTGVVLTTGVFVTSLPVVFV